MGMNKFFNIQTDADGVGTIFLYGDIGDYYDVQSGRVAGELLEAEKAGRRVNIRINSNGGEVYCGIAIYNAIKNSRADVHIYVDGIAASMASVIALCGKPVEMSKYARLMLHSVSGGCYGNKKDMQKCIEEIESLEDSLGDIYAARLGMSKDEVKSRFFDGEDHWLTADEAQRLGFIDGIYDAEPVPAGSTPEQIYTLFNNRLTEPQNKDKMNLEEIRKHPSFKDCKSEEEVIARAQTYAQEAGRASSLAEENATLKKRVKEFEDKAEADKEAARKALLDAAEADGRINAETRPVYENILKSNPEEGEKALAALAPKRKVVEDLKVEPGGESPWNRRMQEIKDKLNKR
jgi:ATP-dependent Clp endopeptidase proteolytic subunit ClpP|uniref:ATP dependent Clp protease n=1 Tax=Siphoviridae sp. ctPEx3 TaxID=2823578 RepID=A0A8S5LFQ5_9CAUD|nr:MAG TPA: Putative ATP dependent Clp protease [Siphoviridae sp. ctPEx3]